MRLYIVSSIVSLVICSQIKLPRVEIGSFIETTDWKIAGRSSPNEVLTLFYSFHDKNIEEFENYALEISNPESNLWGQQLSLHQVVERTSPSREEIQVVVDFLLLNGVKEEEISLGDANSIMVVKSSVKVHEKILQCEFHQFVHVRSMSDYIHRCNSGSSLPANIANIVDFVEPVHGFPWKSPSTRSMPMKDPVYIPVASVDMKMIYDRYNITMGNTDLKVNNTQAVWEYGDNFSPSDVTQFLKTYLPVAENQTIAGYRGNALNDYKGEQEGEAILDVEMIMSTGAFSPTYYYLYNNTDFFAAVLQWVTDLANDPRPPLVHSFSYGQYGGYYPKKVMYKISNEWMKLGTRGVSVFVASGDDGAGCNNGTDSNFTSQPTSFPYPSSPWITLVGSTELQQSKEGAYYEIGSNFSSGGFSSDYAQPKWQAAVVDWWLKNGKTPPKTDFNASGRALPDLSASGENIVVIEYGNISLLAGTSCSSPIVAGMFSAMNGQRLKEGKKPLGFLNQIIYMAQAAVEDSFFDVTEGDNADDDDCSGFYAYKGWDPVTGLGTPNFKSLWENYISKLK